MTALGSRAYTRIMHHRHTLRQSFALTGEGVRSGQAVRVTVEPAASGSGLVLESVGEGGVWPLDLAHTVALPGCTAAGQAEQHVAYIEHFLAACWAVGLTDARLLVEGPELPLLDGSALPWLEAMLAAGLEEFTDPLEPLVVSETVMVVTEHSLLAAFPAPATVMFYLLEHPHPLIGNQLVSFRAAPEAFLAEIAPARTFTTVEEAEYAFAHGLLRGGSEENALVVYPDHLSADPGLPAPCARHKLLDLIGDLYLLGRPVQANLLAHNTGHRLHRAFAKALVRHADTGEPQFLTEG